MSENVKLASELQPGDKIMLETGRVVKVKSVGKGFVRYESGGSVIVEHGAGWSQIPVNIQIEVQS